MDKLKLNKLLEDRRNELLKELESIEVILNAKDSYFDINYLFPYFKPPELKGCVNLGTEINYLGDIDFNSNISRYKYFGGGKVIPIVEKDSNTTWKSYLIDVIRRLNGTAKTNEIAEVMINSINELSFVKARQIAADLLPELVLEGKLEVEKGTSRKEGHTYKLKTGIYADILNQIK